MFVHRHRWARSRLGKQGERGRGQGLGTASAVTQLLFEVCCPRSTGLMTGLGSRSPSPRARPLRSAGQFVPSQHLRLGEAHPPKKRGVRGECWLGSSLAGAGAEPLARSERQRRLHRRQPDPRAEVHGVPWPRQAEMGLGRVHRSPAVNECFSLLGCQ